MLPWVPALARGHGDGTEMAQPDRMGRRVRKSIFLPYNVQAGWLGAAGVGVSVGAGDAPEVETGSLEAVGLHMDPTTDGHSWQWHIPWDMNWVQPIGFKVKYSSASSTSADDRHWVLLYDIVSEDSAIAVATTVLSTAIVAETDNGTADAWQYSPRGILNGETLTKVNVEQGDIMLLNLVLLLDDAGELMNMYGLRIDYMPKEWQGPPPDFNAVDADHGGAA